MYDVNTTAVRFKFVLCVIKTIHFNSGTCYNHYTLLFCLFITLPYNITQLSVFMFSTTAK